MNFLRTPSKGRIRKLNNRQRKKLHLGEYKQLRGDITIRFKQTLDNDAFETWLNAWIEWVEAHGLYVACFGGAEHFSSTDGMLLAEKSLQQEQLDAAVAWLKGRPEVGEIPQAVLRDAVYDEFVSV